MVTEPDPQLPNFVDLNDLVGYGLSTRSLNAFHRNGIFQVDELRKALATYQRLGGWNDPQFSPVGLGQGAVDEANQALAAYFAAHPPQPTTEAE